MVVAGQEESQTVTLFGGVYRGCNMLEVRLEGIYAGSG